MPSTSVASVVTLTNISAWTKDELADCNWNSKAIHAIFMATSLKEFRWVSMCETAKEAWNILKTTNERTKTIEN